MPNRVAQIISEHDEGIYDAMNKGIGLAKGELIGFLHSDDLFTSLKSIVISSQKQDIDGFHLLIICFLIVRCPPDKPFGGQGTRHGYSLRGFPLRFNSCFCVRLSFMDRFVRKNYLILPYK